MNWLPLTAAVESFSGSAFRSSPNREAHSPACGKKAFTQATSAPRSISPDWMRPYTPAASAVTAEAAGVYGRIQSGQGRAPAERRYQPVLYGPEQDTDHGGPEDRLPETDEQHQERDTRHAQQADEERVTVGGLGHGIGIMPAVADPA